MIDKSTLEVMDAYRPGAEDREDPQFAALQARLEQDTAARLLLEKLQVLDTRLTTAFQDVPIPAGLADRLLARIRQAEALAPLAEAEAALASVPENAATPLPSADHGPNQLPANRRTFFKWVAAMAASLLVAGVAYGLWPRHPAPLSEQDLKFMTANWRQRMPTTVAWRKDEKPPQGFAPPAWLQPRINGGWAKAEAVFERPAVAYDVYGSDMPGAVSSATLFVIQAAGEGLSSKPPKNPNSSVSEAWIGCWQHDGLVYVLAVSGPRGDRDYHDLIRQAPAPGPLAQLGSHDDFLLFVQR